MLVIRRLSLAHPRLHLDIGANVQARWTSLDSAALGDADFLAIL